MENRIRPSPVTNFFSHALSLEDQRSQIGLERHIQRHGHSMSCAGTLTSLGDGPTHDHPMGNLTHSIPPHLENFWPFPTSFPLFFSAANIQPNLHNSLGAYCSLRSSTNKSRVSKTLPSKQSQDPSTNGCLLPECSAGGKGSVGPWHICQFDQVWFSYSLLL